MKQGVHAYDTNRPTCIQCDWSKTGIGYVLYQKHCSCRDSNQPILNCCKTGWKVVFAGSRFTSDAESRYAPTEGESLAIAYALNHANCFVLGCPNLTVVTDHKPLLGIFGDRELGKISNPRIRRLKERTLRYNFKIEHCPGKMHLGADALSRYPVSDSTISSIVLQDLCREEINMSYEYEQEMESLATSAVQALNELGEGISMTPNVVTIDMIENAGKSDPGYMALLSQTQQGFPESKFKCHPDIKCFWDKRHSLTTYRNVVVSDDKLVIPKALRKTILYALHSAHQGCDGMLARANNCVYWPQMRQSILNFRASCKSCHINAPSLPKEPYRAHEPAQYPFQKVCADYCVYNQRAFLIIVDRFSAWLHIYSCSQDGTSTSLIKHCRKLFTDYGTPEELMSDGGPQFIANDFDNFLKTWGVEHNKSSAYYPQSNGRAELGVKSAKKILRDNVGPNGSINNDKFSRAILQYRNTPIQGFGISPAQILFCRDLRDFIPSHPKHFKLNDKWIHLAGQRETALSERNMKIAKAYNEHAHELNPLLVGTAVFVQNKHDKRFLNKWNLSGRIVEVLPNRQYKVRMDGSGYVSLRNRRHIKPMPACIGVRHPPYLSRKPTKLVQDEQRESSPTTSTQVDGPATQPNLVPNISEQTNNGNVKARRLANAMKKLASHNKPGRTELQMTGSRRTRHVTNGQ